MLEKVSQRSCGCNIPGSVQGQAGWGFEQTILMKDVSDVSAMVVGFGLDDLWGLGVDDHPSNSSHSMMLLC